MIMSMRPFLLLRLLTVAAITTSIGSCNGNQGLPVCRESEKQALLILKQDLTDPSNRLSSWVADEDSDCCHWAGVVYHHSTTRIHELHLDNPDYLVHPNSSLGGFDSPQLGNLSGLSHLFLAGNYDSLKVENLHWLSGLSRLQHLDMSYVNLSKASDHWLLVINVLAHVLSKRGDE
ncbi:hypothetical protein ACLB2K_075944 [Fragaria x ananassa]